MPDDYPIPRFHFEVDWGGTKVNFTEVTGLIMEREKIEFRHGDDKTFIKKVIPGLMKNNNITLKRGKFEGDFELNDWLEEVATEPIEGRRTVTIRLLNEKHITVATWKAMHCFPVKITASDLKSDANEVAIESMEIAHEGLELMRT